MKSRPGEQDTRAGELEAFFYTAKSDRSSSFFTNRC